MKCFPILKENSVSLSIIYVGKDTVKQSKVASGTHILGISFVLDRNEDIYQLHDKEIAKMSEEGLQRLTTIIYGALWRQSKSANPCSTDC